MLVRGNSITGLDGTNEIYQMTSKKVFLARNIDLFTRILLNSFEFSTLIIYYFDWILIVIMDLCMPAFSVCFSIFTIFRMIAP